MTLPNLTPLSEVPVPVPSSEHGWHFYPKLDSADGVIARWAAWHVGIPDAGRPTITANDIAHQRIMACLHIAR